MKRGTIILAISICFFFSCKSGSPRKEETNTVMQFVLPVPPVILTDPVEQATYVATRYWEGLDYADTTWLTDSVALEQVFAGWIALLARQPLDKGAEMTSNVIMRGNDYPALQLRLAELAEHYFRDPNSPYRNEELYIPILHAIIAAPKIEASYKDRYNYQLEKAMMNRPGTRAANFAFVTRQQRTQSLSDIRSDHVLLYFFNPDCHDCKRVAAYIADSPVFGDLCSKGHLTVLAIYPDKDLQAWEKHVHDMPKEWIVARYADDKARELYNLPAIPNLYLLDCAKKVVLKDAPVEQIEDWLEKSTLPERNEYL